MDYLTTILMAVTLSGAASANEEPDQPEAGSESFAQRLYIEAYGGLSLSDDLSYGCCDFETDEKYNLGGTLGAHVAPRWSVELDVFHAQLDYVGYTSNISSLSVMVNVIHTFNQVGPLHPYVGVGLGATEVNYDGADQFPAFSGEEWTEGYQLMVGGRKQINSELSIFGEYRYNDIFDSVTIKSADNIDIHSHNFSIGLRYDF